MAVKIDTRIVDYEVAQADAETPAGDGSDTPSAAAIEHMHE